MPSKGVLPYQDLQGMTPEEYEEWMTNYTAYSRSTLNPDIPADQIGVYAVYDDAGRLVGWKNLRKNKVPSTSSGGVWAGVITGALVLLAIFLMFGGCGLL